MRRRPFQIKAVLFYWDGTLVRQDPHAIQKLKSRLGCPSQKTLLEFIQSLMDLPEKRQRLSKISAQEEAAAPNLNPHPAALETLQYIIAKKLPVGIISHLKLNTIRCSLQASGTIRESDFDVVISRDEIVQQKPRTDLIRLAAEQLRVAYEDLVVISAHASEIKDARQKGALTIYLNARYGSESNPVKADFEIDHMRDIQRIVRMGLPLPAGKLPNELLGDFLNAFAFDDPSVLINAGVGEDIAAVDIESEAVLVLKSDPITFATDSIGQYAVLINANDIATSGANPRWFLTTLFFPCGTTPSQIKAVFEELKQYGEQWGITLCGGHTEITDAVVRPIVSGMMVGTVIRSALIDKRGMQAGDRVLLTKRVAVEGTAIIAREFGTRLKQKGISQNDIKRCRQFLDRISILAEAKIAAETPGTHAMHDITEGGLAAALSELSIAGDHMIRIDMNQIPVYPETQKICDVLGINPLGLIGSGSLLICCSGADSRKLINRIDAAGIEITRIGEVLDRGRGIHAYEGKKKVSWPSFEADEITKLF
jgi:hydrogenase maturation factor/beta-phosphoglucomutase-like phosphatase (HAD superfamily)